MSLSLSTATSTLSTPKRALVFVAAALVGGIGGSTWNIEASNGIYQGFLDLFFSPPVQISSLLMGAGLGFLLGLIHITSI